MKKEEKVEQNKTILDNFSKEKLEKAAGYFLAMVWAIALVMGLGFNSWSVFFVALFLTVSYLFKINGISSGDSIHESSLNKWHNTNSISNTNHSIKPIGHDWSSATGSNLSRSYITDPSYYYLPNNIYNRR